MLQELTCSRFNASNAGQRFPKLEELSVKWKVMNITDPGSRMPNLKKFICRDMTDADAIRFVVMHSASLMSLKIDQIPSGHSVTYPMLQELTCSRFNASNAGQRFHKLQELRIMVSVMNVSDPESRMPNLKKIISPDHIIVADTSRFVMIHSASLVSLIIAEISDQCVSFPMLEKLICSRFDASNAGQRFPKLQLLRIFDHVMNESDPESRIPTLKKLICPEHISDANISRYMVIHSASLVSLNCRTIPSDQPIVFPKLTDLIVHDLPVLNVSFPVLENLSLSQVKSESLSGLSLTQLKKFTANLIEPYNEAELKAAFTLVSQMVNLTHLSIHGRDMSEYEESAAEFPDLFANMHSLQSVEITRRGFIHPVKTPAHFQTWFSSLVSHNLLLRDIKMDFAVTDENLILCSKLTNLQTVEFNKQGLTITGAVALLRGAWRNVMGEIQVSVDSGEDHEIEQEIGYIESEREVTFHREKAECFFWRYPTLVELKFWLP
jgi:hypothetical protein